MASNAPALQRGIEIINLVSERSDCTPTLIEKELNIPKASCSRLIEALLENNTLEYAHGNRHLKLGKSLTCQVMRSYEKESLVVAVKSMLRRLAEKWGVTFVVYEYLEEFQLIWRVKNEPEGGIKTRPPGFSINHLNINAQGQLFLSMLSDVRIRQYVEKGFAVSHTKHTLTTYDDLLERAEKIRRDKYAYQERESNLSMKQIAVPLNIREVDGIYALGCFLPVDFSETDKLRDSMLLEAGIFCEAE